MIPIPPLRRTRFVLPGLLFALWLVTQAHAQSPATARPDPLDPKALVPPVRYGSAFAQFRRAGDDPPVAWREANDTVARIGGWRTYAREAQQPDPAAAAKPAATPGQATAPAPTPASTPASASAPAPAAKPMPPGPTGHKH